ncbi:MAG TPA: DUF3256 family protein [Bacteroidales bacterium]|nr:DUF3256 family protein [Bacteroidales bacterium]
MRRFYIILMLSCLSVTAVAQSVAHYFTQMPAELIPSITVDTRKDLIDFYQNGKLAVMPAAFGGKVELKTLKDDYLRLQTSESSDIQIKKIQTNDSLQVLAVVRTVAGPLRDSRVKFYDTSWKLLKDWVIPTFTVNDFVDVQQAKALGVSDRLNEIGPRLLVSIHFISNENAFVANSSLKADLDQAQSKVLGAVIRDSVVYRLNNKRFVSE